VVFHRSLSEHQLTRAFRACGLVGEFHRTGPAIEQALGRPAPAAVIVELLLPNTVDGSEAFAGAAGTWRTTPKFIVPPHWMPTRHYLRYPYPVTGYLAVPIYVPVLTAALRAHVHTARPPEDPEPALDQPKMGRPRVAEVWIPAIEELLRREDEITDVELVMRMRALGHPGSEPTVRRQILAARVRVGRPQPPRVGRKATSALRTSFKSSPARRPGRGSPKTATGQGDV